MLSPNHIRPPGGNFVLREEAISELVSRLTGATVDTRAALASFSPVADPAQQAVIRARDHTIRIVAPAGSGKTQTLVNRAVSRIKEGVKSSRILILTFDNAAVLSIREKLQEAVAALSISPAAAAEIAEVSISTLNAFGYGILRDYFPTTFHPLTKAPRPHRLVREARNELRARFGEYHDALPPHFEPGYFLDLFSLLKNNLFDPREFDYQTAADFLLSHPQATSLFPDPADSAQVRHAIDAVLWLFRRYDTGLVVDGTMDFDDQKLRSFVALEENSQVLNVVQKRFDEVIVDEFQDVNRLDFALVRSIAARADLVVTGDDDQAIYGFRGSSPDFIIDLERHLGRPVSSYELSVNYRCPPNLVAHANRLIQQNQRRITKHPVAYRTDPSNILVVSTISASLEAKSVTAFLKRALRANLTLKYKDLAVLYRTNAQSLPMQLEFILNDVPYLVRDEDNILGNEVLDRLLGILRLKLALRSGAEPSVEDSIRAVKGFPPYVEPWQLNRVESVFHGEGSFIEVVNGPEFAAALPRFAKSRFIESVNELVRTDELLQSLDLIRKRWKGMRGMVGSLEDVVAQKASLAEIYEVAASFDGNTVEFVGTLERALDRARQTHAGHEQSGVSLLTYFRAKGRQWHTVALTTCNEGLIPHSRAPIEDERRLFYVALTRASSNLLISYVNDACGTKVTHSRFLDEAGLLEHDFAPTAIPVTSYRRPWYETRKDMPEQDERPQIEENPTSAATQSGQQKPRWYHQRVNPHTP